MQVAYLSHMMHSKQKLKAERAVKPLLNKPMDQFLTLSENNFLPFIEEFMKCYLQILQYGLHT
jgi:hypothetical protein